MDHITPRAAECAAQAGLDLAAMDALPMELRPEGELYVWRSRTPDGMPRVEVTACDLSSGLTIDARVVRPRGRGRPKAAAPRKANRVEVLLTDSERAELEAAAGGEALGPALRRWALEHARGR